MYLKLSISMLLSTMHLHRGTECQENWNDSNFQGGFQTILFTNIREAKSSDPCVHDCIDKVWRHVTRCPSYLDWIVLLSVITYIVIEGPAIYSVQHTHTHPSRENLTPPPATCGPQNWKFDTPPWTPLEHPRFSKKIQVNNMAISQGHRDSIKSF